ncbi:hypothetical protein [Paraburkholderia sp. J67]|uniref:hypothetical protein n=1 Tax=Paraburkholderia sp. J67 TaxID=2805435 RepID=UPI002ABE1D77|nr:hypothetical protein [Paraburkholderia sp. J67]
MDRIDEILLDWHEWQLGYEPVRGYPSDSVFGQAYRSSRQWMDLGDINEEVERWIIEGHSRAIDPLVAGLDLRLRIAVNTAVRNFHAGADIWTNPRWPLTQNADYERAKKILAPIMIARGLLDSSYMIPSSREAGG